MKFGMEGSNDVDRIMGRIEQIYRDKYINKEKFHG